MATQLTAIIFDELASDPGSPAEGQFWFNTTSHEFKGYLDGGIQVIIDKATFDAHATSVLNPHSTTLEKALPTAANGNLPMRTSYPAVFASTSESPTVAPWGWQ